MFRPTDIPFSADDAHRFLPWLIGIMVGLAAFLLCVGISVNGWVIDRHGSYSGHFTVNLPAGDNQLEHTAKVREALKKNPAVGKVTELDDAELKDMLKPWLGNSPMDDLPLPVVLEATLADPEAYFDYSALQKTLSQLAPGVEVDAHERWVTAFSDFSTAIRFLTAMLAALIIGATGTAIVFTARAALKLHARTVHLLHSIGAEDDYIARQFQQETLKTALPGAVLGCLAAGLLYWLMGLYVSSLKLSMLPPLAMTLAHLALLLVLPLVCAAAAWLVVRRSIFTQLQRTL